MSANHQLAAWIFQNTCSGYPVSTFMRNSHFNTGWGGMCSFSYVFKCSMVTKLGTRWWLYSNLNPYKWKLHSSRICYSIEDCKADPIMFVAPMLKCLPTTSSLPEYFKILVQGIQYPPLWEIPILTLGEVGCVLFLMFLNARWLPN